MGNGLSGYVVFGTVVLGPNDVLPDWARDVITNPKAWVDHPAEPPEGEDETSDSASHEGEADRTPTGRPAGNASFQAWLDYATSQGATAQDVDGLSRDDLRELYSK